MQDDCIAVALGLSQLKILWQQLKQDRRLRDKAFFLTLIKRRFRCLWCGKVFTEPDEVFGWRRRSSHRFREYLGQEALHQTVRRTAQKEKVGEGLVRRCVAEEIGRELGAGILFFVWLENKKIS